jgi:hypothetical protein
VAKSTIKIGDRFGRLVVLEKTLTKSRAHWICQCDCGNQKEIRSDSLYSGNTQSCGCLAIESAIIAGKNSKTHGLRNHPLYSIWSNMKNRCYNPACKDYKNYSNSGITVCNRWLDSFENFYEDMKDSYVVGLTLDRKDNSLGYYKENCRWATAKEQAINRKTTHYINTPSGRMFIKEAAEKYGIERRTIHRRIRLGWPEEKLLEKPR